MNGQHALRVVLTYRQRRASGGRGRRCSRGIPVGRAEEDIARRRGDGGEVVVAEESGRRVMFKVPPGMPAVDPSALVVMTHRI